MKDFSEFEKILLESQEDTFHELIATLETSKKFPDETDLQFIARFLARFSCAYSHKILRYYHEWLHKADD